MSRDWKGRQSPIRLSVEAERFLTRGLPARASVRLTGPTVREGLQLDGALLPYRCFARRPAKEFRDSQINSAPFQGAHAGASLPNHVVIH